MKCKYCEKDLMEGAKFCVYCGKPIEAEEPKIVNAEPQSTEPIQEVNTISDQFGIQEQKVAEPEPSMEESTIQNQSTSVQPSVTEIKSESDTIAPVTPIEQKPLETNMETVETKQEEQIQPIVEVKSEETLVKPLEERKEESLIDVVKEQELVQDTTQPEPTPIELPKEPEKQEPNIETKIVKKNNPILIVVIVVLLAIIVGGGIFIYTKYVSNSDNKVVNKPVNEEIKIPSITKEESKKLVDTYYFAGRSLSTNLFTAAVNDEAKKSIAIKNIYEGAKVISCEQISGFAKKDGTCINDERHIVTWGRTIDYDTLNNEYKYLFGKQSSDIPKENIKSLNEITTWEYDSSNNNFLETYIITGFEHADSHIIYDVKDYSQDAEKLIVKVGYISIDPKEENDKVTYLAKVGVEEITYSSEEVEKDNFDKEFISKYLDRLDTYELTFRYEDDHYVFESIKKV